MASATVPIAPAAMSAAPPPPPSVSNPPASRPTGPLAPAARNASCSRPPRSMAIPRRELAVALLNRLNVWLAAAIRASNCAVWASRTASIRPTTTATLPSFRVLGPLKRLLLHLRFHFAEHAPLHEEAAGHGLAQCINVPDAELLGQRKEQEPRRPPLQFFASVSGCLACNPDNRSATMASRCTMALSCAPSATTSLS